MQFHLNYTPKPSDFKIDHDSKIFLTGSCFSENIGNYFQSYKFRSFSNPNGILFNPASIANSLQTIINGEDIDQKFIIQREGLFYSLLHHSSINSSTIEGLGNKINDINKQASEFLRTSDLLIITFGSAFVYRHNVLNKTVANCHKLPGNTFEKRLLKQEQITRNYSTLIQQLQLFNPGLKILFTVSPVKYLRDGIIENNLSKSTLLLSVNELVNKFSNCSYFPAYELVNDDLRDYRFYKEDMAHPNEQAIEYVWQKFSDRYFSQQTADLLEQIHKLNLALQHKVMNTGNSEEKKLLSFIENQRKLISSIAPSIRL
jgi:hypothetical protein